VRDEMTVWAELRAGIEPDSALTETWQTLLRSRLGVDMQVRLVRPGSLADRTGVESRQKPIRLIDRRSA
jgi:phenylacetate-CoA ligase